MAWVGETDKRQLFPEEVGVEGLGAFRADHQDLRAGSNKFVVIMTQLRHMPLAEWSSKSAVQDENDMIETLKIRKRD